MPDECVVLVIDHQPVFLRALADAIAAIPGVRVVTHLCHDGLDDVAKNNVDGVGQDFVHVVVLDPSVSGTFRSEHVRRARERWPMARIAIVTDCLESRALMDSIAYGAESILLKIEPIETIRAGIELVCRGAAAMSLPAATLVAGRVVRPAKIPSLAAPLARGLSPREVEILQLVARGHTDSETAGMLGISVSTAQRHITNILNKLGCRNRTHAVAQALGPEPPLARVR